MFKNRNLAAERLAERLREKSGEPDFVSAVTLDSVETAEVVAEKLGLPVNHVISTKLLVPGRKDLVFGAVSYDGTIWLNDDMIEEFMIDRGFIADYAERKRAELQDRMRARGIETGEDMKSKDVLLVADGVSSGMMVISSLGTCIKKNVRRTQVAAPFISKHGKEKILGLADEVFSLKTPRFVASVNDGYGAPEEKIP